MKKLPIAVNTYSYIYSLSALDAIRHLLGLGFVRFELLFNAGHIWVSDLEPSLRNAPPAWLANEGAEIVSFNLPIMDHNLTSPNLDMRLFTRTRFTELIELAGAWSVPYVVLVPGKVSPLLPAPETSLLGWFVDGLGALAELASQHGTKILVENVPSTFAPLAVDLVRALRQFDDNRIAVVYDVANGLFAGEDPADGIKMLSDSVELIHLSDTGTKLWRHDPVGAGEVDFRSVAEAIRSIGFSGQSVMEIISPNPDYDLVNSRQQLAEWGWQNSEEG